MLNKKTFLMVLNFLVFSSSFSNITQAETVYYRDNKWDFMEREFINKVDYMSKEPGVDGTFFILPMVVSSLIFLTEMKRENKLKIYFASSFLLSIANYFRLKSKPCSLDVDEMEDNLLVILDGFFSNYTTDEKSNLKVNYRNFVPEELLVTFDEIYASYLENGSKCLDYFLGIICKIRDRIFFDIKKEKYKKSGVILR